MPDVSELVEPITEADHATGPADAPVTLVEYGDYECPDCFNALPIVKGLREKFGERLRIVFRHFPNSSIHPGASAAAAAAEAASLQGRFWEMHDALFRRQHDLADVDLTHLALRISLEVYRFERDLESEANARRVRHDLESGQRSGVKGTPTFFINGKRYRGVVDLPSMVAAIETAQQN